MYELTGKPMTELQQAAWHDACPYKLLKIALIPENRAWLHARLAQRFAQMLEQGVVEEVRKLFARGDLDTHQPAIRAVGYRQIWGYLINEMDYNQMRDRAIVATRQLAKRQMTWLRSEKDIIAYDPRNSTFHRSSTTFQRLLADERIRPTNWHSCTMMELISFYASKDKSDWITGNP